MHYIGNVENSDHSRTRAPRNIGKSSNGRTTDSDSVYLGSNPSFPANLNNEGNMVDLNFIPETREPTVKGDCGYILLSTKEIAYFDAKFIDSIYPYKSWTASGRRDAKARYATHGVHKEKSIKLHQLIKTCSREYIIDHINGNGLDNREENLRVCTIHQNNMNRPPNKNSSSKYKGVSWNKASKKWCSRIKLNGKDFTFGFFNDEIEAAIEYDKRVKEFHGDFSWYNRDNFPELLEYQ